MHGQQNIYIKKKKHTKQSSFRAIETSQQPLRILHTGSQNCEWITFNRSSEAPGAIPADFCTVTKFLNSCANQLVPLYRDLSVQDPSATNIFSFADFFSWRKWWTTRGPTCPLPRLGASGIPVTAKWAGADPVWYSLLSSATSSHFIHSWNSQLFYLYPNNNARYLVLKECRKYWISLWRVDMYTVQHQSSSVTTYVP